MNFGKTVHKGLLAAGLGFALLATPAVSATVAPTEAQATVLSEVSPYFRSRAKRMKAVECDQFTDVPYIHFKAGMQRSIPGWTTAGYEACVEGVGNGMANMWIGEPGISNGIETIDFAVFNSNGSKYTNGLDIDCSVQGRGWMGGFYHGATYGQKGKRMEAIKMVLSGKLAQKYDIWYRAHCQGYGWMAWAKNGAAAGTYGQSKRMEAVQVVLLKKGSAAPSKNLDGARQAYGKAYENRTSISNATIKR